MGNFYWNDEFLGQNWGKKEAILLGKQPYKEEFFGPEVSKEYKTNT